MKSILAIAFLASLLLLLFEAQIVTPVKAITTWIVPKDFATIQAAIDAAKSGDTIMVLEGTYAEGQIIVGKPLTLRGNGSVMVDGLQKGHVFLVTANNVTIESFIVMNSKDAWGYSGIRLQNVENCIISGNVARNNTNGFGVGGSGYNVIKENNATNNRIGIGLYGARFCVIERNMLRNNYYGMRLYRSDENLVEENVAIDNGVLPGELGIGIYLEEDSDRNLIGGNMLIGNRWTGILVWTHSDGNTIKKNSITNSYNGIYLAAGSVNNTIYKNAINATSWAGIKLRGGSESNTIISNIVKDTRATGPGFFISYCNGNIFAENLIANVPQWVYSEHSFDNVLYHNNFLNAYTPYGIPKIGIVNSANIWNHGYPSGGNYWSDHEGSDDCSGPHQNETKGDGITDTPYVIDENNRDNYPLTEPWEEPAMIKLLIRTIWTWDLPKGTENSLTSKLEDAIHLLETGNQDGAIHKLMDFITQVEALRDKKLIEEQSNYLIMEVQKIVDLIRE